MKTRIISAAVLLPLLIFVLIKGDAVLASFCLACIIIGVNEFCNALGENSSKSTKVLLFLASVIQVFAMYKNYTDITIVLTFTIIFIQGAMVVFEKISPVNAALSVFTFFYVTVSMSYIYLISSSYPKFFPYIFILSMVTDTFAYFSGVFFGKHKLSPNLSPKKTIEGSIGGIVFCVGASFLYALVYHKEFLVYVIPFAILGSIISQIGDIFASAFKRAMNIKDYGNLIPGHGGILDRADSVIFTTSFVYVTALILK